MTNLNKDLKIPKIQELTKEEIINILREELERKDKKIKKLEEEKEILFRLSIKHVTDKLKKNTENK